MSKALFKINCLPNHGPYLLSMKSAPTLHKVLTDDDTIELDRSFRCIKSVTTTWIRRQVLRELKRNPALYGELVDNEAHPYSLIIMKVVI